MSGEYSSYFTAMSITKFSGKVYPDKSFTIGVVPTSQKKLSDSKYDREWENQYDSYWEVESKFGQKTLTEVRFISNPYEKEKDNVAWLYESGNLKVAVLDGITETLVPVKDISVDCLDRIISCNPLLVKSPKSSQKKRGKYGKNGITNYGRRFVKNACILLQQRYGKRQLGFGTATLPGMDRDTCHAVNGAISDITRRFYQKIRRKYQKRGSRFIYVGVVEIQEERFRNTGYAVPHLHFVFVAKDSVRSGYTCTVEDFYTAWNESVNECLIRAGKEPVMGYGKHCGSVKLEPIRSSASAYMGKYLSKGVKVVKDMQEKGFEDFPKQWWTACTYTKKLFALSIVVIPQDICAMLFYDCQRIHAMEMIAWMQTIWISHEGREYRCGLTGTLSDEMYNYIKMAYQSACKQREEKYGYC